MESHIRRRKFLATLCGAAATWPLAARAQQPKVPTIGALVIGNISPEQFWREFRQGLRDLGFCRPEIPLALLMCCSMRTAIFGLLLLQLAFRRIDAVVATSRADHRSPRLGQEA
jgi:hypothetical protein